LIAYRDITLDIGKYDIAYDWKGTGNAGQGYLKVVYANRPTNSIKCVGNSVVPTWVNSKISSVKLTGNLDSLNNGESWRHVQARISIENQGHANKETTRLFFVWVNTSANKNDSLTSIAIDNFQLGKASATDYPTNLHVTTTLNNTMVTWEGSADSYEVMYRPKNASDFSVVPANGNTVTLTDVDYGAYEFWICSVNGADKTVYSVFPTVYLYETDCFDALNMYNARYLYGDWPGGNKEIKGEDKVDFGPKDIRSRHTTHFDRDEVDTRTLKMRGRDTIEYLKTVPDGEFGSVRLGNWATGSQYESISYDYTVESNSSAIMLLHYAMVLENPDHIADDQPRFTLDVTTPDGKSIDTKCAQVNFHAPTSTEQQNPEIKALWHTSDQGYNWQEWKTIGINLVDYIGETLTITFTSYDCDQGGHFGYAYFMLNCSRNDVDGIPWGEGSSTQSFTVPSGFNYAWFNREDTAYKEVIDNTDTNVYPYIAGGGRYLYVHESDTNTYLCHATYPSNPDCGFWYDASAKPHNPKAELAWEWTPENCTNSFVLRNLCHVMLTNQLTGELEHRYDKQLDECYLILEDGTEQAIGYDEQGLFIPMPDEGGTLRYGIRTGIYINGQLLADTAWYDIEVPAVGPLETHLYDTICRGESITFPIDSGTEYSDSGTYTDSLKSVITGCDSTVLMHLLVHEPIYAEIYDTICFGGSYVFNGRTLTTSTQQTMVLHNASLVTGCDSIVTLNLTVAPRPRLQLADKHLCGDQQLVVLTQHSDYADSIRVVVTGALDTVASFNREPDAETRIPISNQEVGERKAVVYTYMPWCDQQFTDTLTFDVSLSASVVEARFNNVLAFLNADYNGGLEFSAFQWYANGELIPGATGSWYHETTMDPNKEFMVDVTMADGSHVWTCPFSFGSLSWTQGTEDVHTSPISHKILRDGRLIILSNGHEYNAQGQLLR
nr:fibronectin type III domain-containing protein [Paludibacteraceae bacterium]